MSNNFKKRLLQPGVQNALVFLAGVLAMLGTFVTMQLLSRVYFNLTPRSYTNFEYMQDGFATVVFTLMAVVVYAIGIVLVGWAFQSLGHKISFSALRVATVTVALGALGILWAATGPAFQSQGEDVVVALLHGSSFGLLYLFGWQLGQYVAPFKATRQVRPAARPRRTVRKKLA